MNFVLHINKNHFPFFVILIYNLICDSQAPFDEYREKIATLERELEQANANKPNENEISALKLKIEGIYFEISNFVHNSSESIFLSHRTDKIAS